MLTEDDRNRVDHICKALENQWALQWTVPELFDLIKKLNAETIELKAQLHEKEQCVSKVWYDRTLRRAEVAENRLESMKELLSGMSRDAAEAMDIQEKKIKVIERALWNEVAFQVGHGAADKWIPLAISRATEEINQES